MKFILNSCVVILICVLSYPAQTPTAKVKSNDEILLELKVDYDPKTDGSPLILLDVPKDEVAYHEKQTQAIRLLMRRKISKQKLFLNNLCANTLATRITGGYWRLRNKIKQIPALILPTGSFRIRAIDQSGNEISVYRKYLKTISHKSKSLQSFDSFISLYGKTENL